MRFLLDTNVVSEPIGNAPNRNVVDWIADQDPFALHLSVVTFAEIGAGIGRLPPSRRRGSLEDWRERLLISFADRVLHVDLDVADAWGSIRARLSSLGASIGPIDAFLAATAQVHGLMLVTRNVRDFALWEGPLFDPWPKSEPT